MEVKIVEITDMDQGKPTVLFRISEPYKRDIDIEIELNRKAVGSSLETWLINAKSQLILKLETALNHAKQVQI